MASIDDDQPATEKTRSEPDRATTEAALRSSAHTSVDYSRFDAVEVPEEVVIERRSWGPTRDKRTAPLRITLNAKRFTLAGPWLRRSVCDLGRAYLKASKAFRVFRLDGAAQTRVELGLLAEVGECLRDGDILRVEVTGDPAVDVMEFPLEWRRLSSGGVLRGPSTTVDAYVDGRAQPDRLSGRTRSTRGRRRRARRPPRPRRRRGPGRAAGFRSPRRSSISEPRAPPSPSSADTASRCRVPSASRASRRRPVRDVVPFVVHEHHAAIAARALTLVDARPADAVEIVDAPAGRRGRRRWRRRPARAPGARRVRRCMPASRAPSRGSAPDASSTSTTSTPVPSSPKPARGACCAAAAPCCGRRGRHGRVDHQTDGYDGKVLEVHFFSRRASSGQRRPSPSSRTRRRTTPANSNGVNDADFVLPERWSSGARRRAQGLVPEPLDALGASRSSRWSRDPDAAGAGGWRGNGAPAAAYRDVDAEVPSDAQHVREWEKRRIVRLSGVEC